MRLSASPPASRADLAQAALLLLAPAGSGTRTVVLGENAPLLAAAAGFLAGEGLAVLGGPGALRQLEPASCDTVVLNQALERLVPRDDAAQAQALFGECLRVLKPGGRILLTMDNPYSISNIARALRSAGSGIGGLARRRRLCLRALRMSCRITDVYLLWPRAGAWRVLRPEASGLPLFVDTSLRGRLQQLIRATARIFGSGSALAPGHLYVARRAGETEGGCSLAECLQRAEGLQGAPLTIDARPNSRSATFAAGSLFFKVPLSPRGAEALSAEVANLAALAGTDIARCAPLPAQLREHAGVGYATFARLPPCGRSFCESDMLDFISALHRQPSPGPLSQTDFWSRIFADDVQSMLRQLGASALLDYLQQHGAARMTLVAPIHGDLHSGNVLAGAGCRYLVDWDRYEARSPVLLDYAEAFLSCAGLLYREDRSLPLGALLTAMGRRDTLLAQGLTRSLGELTPAEAMTVYVLHRVSWLLRRHGLSEGPELDVVHDRIALCRQLLGLDG